MFGHKGETLRQVLNQLLHIFRFLDARKDDDRQEEVDKGRGVERRKVRAGEKRIFSSEAIIADGKNWQRKGKIDLLLMLPLRYLNQTSDAFAFAFRVV